MPLQKPPKKFRPFWKCKQSEKLSANKFLNRLHKEKIYKKCNSSLYYSCKLARGSRCHPCGTPDVMMYRSDCTLFTFTICNLFEIFDAVNRRKSLYTAILASFCIKMLRFNLLNALPNLQNSHQICFYWSSRDEPMLYYNCRADGAKCLLTCFLIILQIY